MLYETIDLQSTYSSCVSCFLFLCVFNLLNFMILRNGKVRDAIFKSFQNKQVKFLSKHFAENGKEKLFLNDSSFLSNLENAKTNTVLTIHILK